MIGFKHIPQTVTGEKADEILKKLPGVARTFWGSAAILYKMCVLPLPEKDCQEQKKSLAPLPDKFTVSSKK